MNKSDITILHPSDYKIMKWKNGRGETSEIARFPSVDPFLWRLSMAPVIENGQWSLFPGYDRYLTLVEGRGVKLKDNIVYNGDVIKFSGDENISAELIDGKIIDLNLIVRRNQVQVKYEIIKLTKDPYSFLPQSRVTLIFGLSGNINISKGNASFIIEERDTIQIEDSKGEMFTIRADKTNSSFVYMELDWQIITY